MFALNTSTFRPLKGHRFFRDLMIWAHFIRSVRSPVPYSFQADMPSDVDTWCSIKGNVSNRRRLVFGLLAPAPVRR